MLSLLHSLSEGNRQLDELLKEDIIEEVPSGPTASPEVLTASKSRFDKTVFVPLL